MRPYQWEPLPPRPAPTRRDWRLFAVLLAPWLALALADYLGL